jgi:hypothetical protein
MKIQRFNEDSQFDKDIKFVEDNFKKTTYKLCTCRGSRVLEWYTSKSLEECLSTFEEVFLSTNAEIQNDEEGEYIFIMKTTVDILDEEIERYADAKKYNL